MYLKFTIAQKCMSRVWANHRVPAVSAYRGERKRSATLPVSFVSTLTKDPSSLLMVTRQLPGLQRTKNQRSREYGIRQVDKAKQHNSVHLPNVLFATQVPFSATLPGFPCREITLYRL